MTFGLSANHRTTARWFGLVALGLSVACVYTRYHHGIDVLAGFTVGAVGAAIGYRLNAARLKRLTWLKPPQQDRL